MPSHKLPYHALCDIRAVSKFWNDPQFCVKSFSVYNDVSTARVHYYNHDGRFWYSFTVYDKLRPYCVLNSCVFFSSLNRSLACCFFLRSSGWKEFA